MERQIYQVALTPMPIPSHTSTRGHRTYQNLQLADLNNSTTLNYSPAYRLRRYKWRTFFNILGPSFVLGYYGFVCFYFLANPPVNDIVPSRQVDARGIFYMWVFIMMFLLEWARRGWANVEATALMHPRLAPESAMELMWHADSNWNNVMWWLQALRNNARYYFSTSQRKSNHLSRPGCLWWLLSAVTLLLLVAVPLSGLSMEITDAHTYDTRKALILGPVSDNFNFLRFMNLPSQIRTNWRSGRVTTPSDSSILYAPEGSSNVSMTYYQDQILLKKEKENPVIRIFAGPAVNEMVVGKAWGLSANISCRATPKEDLKLFDVHDYNKYTMKDGLQQSGILQWINETGLYTGKHIYSLLVASDGTTSGDPPYCVVSNHDNQTLDHRTRPLTDVTTGVLEAYLWQGLMPGKNDAAMDQLLVQDASSIISVGSIVTENERYKIPMVGFGVHCDVTSAVGTAHVDPARRTYSSFQLGFSPQQLLGTDDTMAYPVQVQAFRAVADYNQYTNKVQARDATRSDSSWVAAHFAVGLFPYSDNNNNNTAAIPETFADETDITLPALTPTNLTNAVYKLLGESVIALMGSSGAHTPSYGDLYGLKPVQYIKPGIIDWRIILSLLSLWAFSLLSASVWMAFNRRWAPYLGGFDFFKFGAQYTAQVNSFSSTRFDECTIPLRGIPGMVGTLSGEALYGEQGFIGLSRRVARRGGRFVHDRARSRRDPW